ncbi:MAG TPA: NAD-glutamate dehydrogenase domain-containing protein, partial [Sphingomonas sp.]|nr:NAD-glutamate dehydrogenase domain-containing protein [Sphingomonas sp.]
RVIHPVVRAIRSADGVLEDIGGAGSPESMIYIEMERVDARERRDLVDDLGGVLADVRAAVADWPRLQRAMARDEAALPQGEGAALLQWFLDGQFTLLGHQDWQLDGSEGEALGIAHNEHRIPILAEASRTLAVEWFEAGGEAPLLLKSSLISTVHRAVPLDLVLVPIMAGGKVTGLSIHSGLWTSAALATPPRGIPVLRARLAALEAKFGFDPKGHAGKALTHALTALPHDIVIAFTPDQLEDLALTAMSLADRPRPAMVLVRSALGRHMFAFAWLPRDELTTARRVAIGDMLAEAANGSILNWSIALDDGTVALLRYTVDLRGAGRMPDVNPLAERLERMVRGWVPDVEAALAETVSTQRAARLALRWAGTFPQNYRNVSTAEEAAADILRIAGLDSPENRAVRLFPAVPGEDRRLKIYKLGALALSDAVPVLENFGFRVIGELPTRLRDETDAFVHDFVVEVAAGADGGDVAVLEGAIAAVLEGRAENDAFNQLIVSAGMAPQAVVLFRAWFRYLRQAGLPYGLTTVVDAIRRAPKLGAALIERFVAAHDPAGNGDIVAADAAIERGLDAVSAIDDDRILRAYRNLVAATLRTNAFAPASTEALAFKLDSHLIPGLPAPVPWREIWVYSPRVEGIHLRAGPVARGGLRWSDRRDDFRVEILGLMKAQRVKNAVIVPTGAKGGFYPKQ